MNSLKNLPIRFTVMGIMIMMLLLCIADSLMLLTAETVTGWRRILKVNVAHIIHLHI